MAVGLVAFSRLLEAKGGGLPGWRPYWPQNDV